MVRTKRFCPSTRLSAMTSRCYLTFSNLLLEPFAKPGLHLIQCRDAKPAAYSAQRLKTRHPLVPPNPNEFESA
jgi:hypothetical protein